MLLTPFSTEQLVSNFFLATARTRRCLTNFGFALRLFQYCTRTLLIQPLGSLPMLSAFMRLGQLSFTGSGKRDPKRHPNLPTQATHKNACLPLTCSASCSTCF